MRSRITSFILISLFPITPVFAQQISTRDLKYHDGKQYYNTIPFTGEIYSEKHPYIEGARQVRHLKYKDGLLQYYLTRDFDTKKNDSSDLVQRYRYISGLDSLIDKTLKLHPIELCDIESPDTKGRQLDILVIAKKGSLPKDYQTLLKNTYRVLRDKKIITEKKYVKIVGFAMHDKSAEEHPAEDERQALGLLVLKGGEAPKEDDVKFEVH